MGLNGFGYNDKGFYDSEGLKSWTMEGTESKTLSTRTTITAVRSTKRGDAQRDQKKIWDGKVTDIKWVKKDPTGHGNDMVMPEDGLGALEREIMKSWPDVEKGFAMIRPGAHPLKLLKSATDPSTPEPSPGFTNGKKLSGSGGKAEDVGGDGMLAAKKSATMQTI